MRITVKDLFDYTPGNHGLTEETIYFHQADAPESAIPVYSGSASNDKPIAYISRTAKNNKDNPVTYFRGPCLILTKDGSAGLLTYVGPEAGEFTINHHACVLKLKGKYKNVVDLNWFEFQYKSLFYKYISSKSDNGVFSIEWFDRIEVEVPDMKFQLNDLKKRRTIFDAAKKLASISVQVRGLLGNEVVSTESGEPVTVGTAFNFFGGNSGLIEELIYNHQATADEAAVKVLSGATTDTNALGSISADVVIGKKKLKTFEGPGIVVIRKGLAGKMKYFASGKFTINDDAYVMKVRPEWQSKVNPVWFMHQYQSLFFNIVTSKSDNGTFSKEYASQQLIVVPSIGYQNRIAQRYMLLERVASRVDALNKKIRSGLYSEVRVGAAE